MRFSMYHPWVYLTGGAERLLLEVMQRSRHDWVLHTHRFDADSTFPGFRDLEVLPLKNSVSIRRSLLPLAHAAASMASATLPDVGAQGLLVSSEGLGDLVVRKATLPSAVYCHTPLKILHDPVTRAALRERAPGKSRVLDVLGPPFNAVDRMLWSRYEHVFANSFETKRRITAARLATADRIEVAHPGVDSSRYTAPPDTWAREPIFLVAGRIQWQKRIETAVEALRVALRAPGSAGMRLVVAGAVDTKSTPYLDMLRSQAAGLPVEFVVNPDDATLRALYGNATALVFSAPNEDFGIVPLEAMSSGTPVIAVDSGGPRETVVHDETGWLLPNTPYAFALRMLSVAVSSPADLAPMREAGRRRAEAFSWKQTIDRIDDVMERLALGERNLAVAASVHEPAPHPREVASCNPAGPWERRGDVAAALEDSPEGSRPRAGIAS